MDYDDMNDFWGRIDPEERNDPTYHTPQEIRAMESQRQREEESRKRRHLARLRDDEVTDSRSPRDSMRESSDDGGWGRRRRNARPPEQPRTSVAELLQKQFDEETIAEIKSHKYIITSEDELCAVLNWLPMKNRTINRDAFSLIPYMCVPVLSSIATRTLYMRLCHHGVSVDNKQLKESSEDWTPAKLEKMIRDSNTEWEECIDLVYPQFLRVLLNYPTSGKWIDGINDELKEKILLRRHARKLKTNISSIVFGALNQRPQGRLGAAAAPGMDAGSGQDDDNNFAISPTDFRGLPSYDSMDAQNMLRQGGMAASGGGLGDSAADPLDQSDDEGDADNVSSMLPPRRSLAVPSSSLNAATNARDAEFQQEWGIISSAAPAASAIADASSADDAIMPDPPAAAAPAVNPFAAAASVPEALVAAAHAVASAAAIAPVPEPPAAAASVLEPPATATLIVAPSAATAAAVDMTMVLRSPAVPVQVEGELSALHNSLNHVIQGVAIRMRGVQQLCTVLQQRRADVDRQISEATATAQTRKRALEVEIADNEVQQVISYDKCMDSLRNRNIVETQLYKAMNKLRRIEEREKAETEAAEARIREAQQRGKDQAEAVEARIREAQQREKDQAEAAEARIREAQQRGKDQAEAVEARIREAQQRELSQRQELESATRALEQRKGELEPQVMALEQRLLDFQKREGEQIRSLEEREKAVNTATDNLASDKLKLKDGIRKIKREVEQREAAVNTRSIRLDFASSRIRVMEEQLEAKKRSLEKLERLLHGHADISSAIATAASATNSSSWRKSLGHGLQSDGLVSALGSVANSVQASPRIQAGCGGGASFGDGGGASFGDGGGASFDEGDAEQGPLESPRTPGRGWLHNEDNL